MSKPPAGWYPDPTRRYPYRYWDGENWTEHVGRDGVAATDPMPPSPLATTQGARGDASAAADDRLEDAEIRGILDEAGVQPVGPGDGTLFGEPVLIVYQSDTGLAEGFRYGIVSPAGAVVGRYHETVADELDPAQASFGEMMDRKNTDRFELVDQSGATWAQLAHKKVWKSKVTVTDPAGQEIGLFQQENVLGKVRLGLEAGGRDLGEIVSDNTLLEGFTITDASKTPIGRVTKLGRYAQPRLLGRPLRVPGCYVVQLQSRPAQPMHSLVVAAPLAIDLAFSVTQAGQRSLGRTITGE